MQHYNKKDKKTQVIANDEQQGKWQMFAILYHKGSWIDISIKFNRYTDIDWLSDLYKLVKEIQIYIV
jgi:hypothetical protein